MAPFRKLLTRDAGAHFQDEEPGWYYVYGFTASRRVTRFIHFLAIRMCILESVMHLKFFLVIGALKNHI